MNFLLGAIFFALGVVVLYYRYRIASFTGEWSLAIKYLGSNGTIVAITLIGMFLIAIGTAYPFGAFNRGDSTGLVNVVGNP